MNTKKLLPLLCVLFVTAQTAFAQISYTGGGSLTENFDSIGPDGTEPPSGWLAGSYATVQNRVDPASEPVAAELVPDDGSSATKATSYNYGELDAADRAIGSIGTTASGDRAIQVAITNNSGKELPGIGLTYTGEQWRDYQGTSTSGDEQFRMFFSTEPGSDFTAYPDLDFFRPSNLGLNAAIDGNDPANRTTIGGTIAPPSPVGIGETFYLTWHDYNDNATNDHGLAIDDVIISFISNLGDFNEDGVVDTADYQVLVENFNSSGTFAQGDATFDGVVDLHDFLLFREAFEEASVGVAAVPEPNSLALVLISVSLLMVTRRHTKRG